MYKKNFVTGDLYEKINPWPVMHKCGQENKYCVVRCFEIYAFE